MRPTLAIGPLTNLQDARSSAAVGFDMILFSLERGSLRMLGSNLIWNIASWLSGPSIVLELNRHSLDELKDMGESVSIGALSFPVEDWREWMKEGVDPLNILPVSTVILRISGALDDAEIHTIQKQAIERGIAISFVANVENAVSSLEKHKEYISLHFQNLETATEFVKNSSWQPAGILLGAETEEEFGILDYEAIDEWLEVVNERFEEE